MNERWDGLRPTTGGRQPRLRLRFDGALDDVPMEVAAALARVTRVLLDHQGQHAGGTVMMRISSTRSRVGIWVVDPECSEACLSLFGRVGVIRAERVHGAGDVTLRYSDSPEGLRLVWSVHLPRLARGRSRLRSRLAGTVRRPARPMGRATTPVARPAPERR